MELKKPKIWNPVVSIAQTFLLGVFFFPFLYSLNLIYEWFARLVYVMRCFDLHIVWYYSIVWLVCSFFFFLEIFQKWLWSFSIKLIVLVNLWLVRLGNNISRSFMVEVVLLWDNSLRIGNYVTSLYLSLINVMWL